MTVPALADRLKGLLTRAGVDNPDGDAREILCTLLGCSRSALITHRDREVDQALCDRALAMAKRRADGEPIQYILGSWSFMGREYKVGRGVLIPRDDTEVVVTAALRLLRNVPRPAVADLCAGTGIIAVTIGKECPDATVYAVEKSEEAFSYLKENIALHRAKAKAIHADLADCADDFADGSLDMIVSNPPYIRSEEISSLQSEVQYEPVMALDGGADGYVFYKLILDRWTAKLKKGGRAAFEIGEGQFETIRTLLIRHGFTDIKGYPDIQGITRAVTARLDNTC